MPVASEECLQTELRVVRCYDNREGDRAGASGDEEREDSHAKAKQTVFVTVFVDSSSVSSHCRERS